MFERRLKIFVALLAAVTLVLIGRAFAVQVVGRDYWEKQTAGLATRLQYTETTRGRILDVKGRVLAVDVPCTDACVDYRAITVPPDPKWVAEVAVGRVKARLGKADWDKLTKDGRAEKIAAEDAVVRDDVTTMWATLSVLYRPTEPDEVDNPAAVVDGIRNDVVQMVEARRRHVFEHRGEQASARAAGAHWWVRWLAGGGGGAADKAGADPMAGIVVAEQRQSHVILHAVDADAGNFLGKRLDVMPGLSLKPSTRRLYPMKTVAAHVLGRESRVNSADVAAARPLNLDDARQYRPNDPIGRDGAEMLCEPVLRGTRGRIETRTADGATVGQLDFTPGADATLTIDADLQQRVEDALRHVVIQHGDVLATPPDGQSMHAAVVVLDVRTNAVLAMASNPGFDVNDLHEHYAKLVADDLEAPLRNRATSDACEPGSTAKPMIGIGAITDGTVGPLEGIECTGYLRLAAYGPDGRKTGRLVAMPKGRCWVASLWEHKIPSVAHHPVPNTAPHVGHDGNPDGFLTYADALERSCNVFFETTADRMGPAGVDKWLAAFGIGRRTGVGIYEVSGMRPPVEPGPPPTTTEARMPICYSGIGEGQVQATPLQIANEAATFARDGVWMRPRLLSDQTQQAVDRARPRPAGEPPDAVDLHLDPAGLAQAKLGMRAVVDAPGGSGRIDHPAWLTLACKTGTAEVSKLTYTTTDEAGNKVRRLLPFMYPGDAPTPTPWYKAADPAKPVAVQNWYMGYAPAEHPTVAFAVLIEYAGSSGGRAAGPVATKVLDACVADGYLVPPTDPSPAPPVVYPDN